ncbi:MAG: Ribonuclease HII [Chlamydiia bacterium]|nr:Ribonuclease HII [Chlamydiia bacterium]MCH9615947.1 Ribonuclease HII [Chlamydiia bacterium]MCH9628650.1 Ribonuclease HII [Chlamydiia bacterium]
MREFEQAAYLKGHTLIAGVDEAGRGPLAGPVVAAACIIPPEKHLPDVDDSKKLTPKKRENIYRQLMADHEILTGIGIIEAPRIDEINILQATFEAMLLAVSKLPKQPDYLLIDGNMMPKTPIPGEAIIEGDGRSLSIAAASILAKHARDIIMKSYHLMWPEYGFDGHKGYATKAHLEAINTYGPCPIHRRSFKPISQFVVAKAQA